MIKRGDFVKCTRDIYAITDRDTVCLVINDSNFCDKLPPNRISVMVIEDYSSDRNFRGIGCIYTVVADYFEKIDYVDEQKRNRERMHKLIMKLANNNMPITQEKINNYASKRQLAIHFSDEKRNTFYIRYVEDCILKTYEISLNAVTNDVRCIYFHEINCFSVEGTYDNGAIRTIEQLLRKNKRKVKTTKLFEK